jgi:uncharacterized membrane protein YkvA (DUF1232 family)
MRTIDQSYMNKDAESVTEQDFRYVVDQSNTMTDSFIGRGPFGKVLEEIILAISIIKDYVIGRYRKIPCWAIGAIVFTVLYVGNPVDVIPDFILGVGQIDDILVVTLCLLMIRQELHEYKAWKLQQNDDIWDVEDY